MIAVTKCPVCNRPAKITKSKKVQHTWDSPAGTIKTKPYVWVDAVHENGTDPHIWADPLEKTIYCTKCGHSEQVHIPTEYIHTLPKEMDNTHCLNSRCDCKGFEPS